MGFKEKFKQNVKAPAEFYDAWTFLGQTRESDIDWKGVFCIIRKNIAIESAKAAAVGIHRSLLCNFRAFFNF